MIWLVFGIGSQTKKKGIVVIDASKRSEYPKTGSCGYVFEVFYPDKMRKMMHLGNEQENKQPYCLTNPPPPPPYGYFFQLSSFLYLIFFISEAIRFNTPELCSG
ncbi:MAG: hypothetical protein LBG24_06850 [Treponema sp.]|nr:hypothetical protein [Treponema sp.]